MEYFNKYFVDVVKKYVVFEGRARRKEYWFFVLFFFLISLVLSVIERTLGLYASGVGFLTLVLNLGLLLPNLAVGARRLHDIGKSGWWLLISFIPILGAIVLLIFFCIRGENGENQYGPDPIID